MNVLSLSLLINAVLLVLACGMYVLFRRYQKRLYIHQGRKLSWPIPTVALHDFHAAFTLTEHGPTLAAEVWYVGRGDGVPGGTSDTETWILSVLSKDVLRMFEFGTCTGKTAYLWARNSSPEAIVTTLTLAPDQLDQYQPGEHDRTAAADRALAESLFTRFLYSGTEVESKIEQLFGDSKDFDETPFLQQCDLIFVDGSHAYSYVKNDSEKALRMLKPGGIILWHDYNALTHNTDGVFDYLNELHQELPLVHLRGTNLVAYRSVADSGERPIG